MLLWANERVICERVQAALTWCKAWRYFGISEILYGSHRKMYTVEILKSAFTVRFPSRLTFHTWRFARCCVCSSLWQGFMSCLNPHIYLALFSAQWSFWANVRENVASNMGALFSHTKFQNILQSSFLLLLFDLAVVIHPFCLVQGDCYKQAWVWFLASAREDEDSSLLFLGSGLGLPSQVTPVHLLCN